MCLAMNRFFTSILLGVSAALALTSAVPATAQLPVQPAPATPRAPADPAPAASVAPGSPRASLRRFLEAASDGRWDEAAGYLSLTAEQQSRGPELAQRLKGVLDSSRWIDVDSLSPEAGGRVDDGLPPEFENVAVTLRGEEPADSLRLVRVTVNGEQRWVVAPVTVALIDGWYEALPDRWIRDILVDLGAEALLQPGPFDLLWWHWIILPILALIAWAAGHGLRGLTRIVVSRLGSPSRAENVWRHRILAGIGPPLTLAWAILVFALGCLALQLTERAGNVLGGIVSSGMLVALFWAVWRSVDVLSHWVLSLPDASARSLFSVGANLLRGIIFIAGVLAVVSALGYPVGTVLAGLGIGGIAIAFGAQKTIENLFGSISLAVDQPFRVGDFVKVEDFVGTVEEIGLRSTRFRTLDRTLVSIPNGKVADQRLESFEVRDRMRLATTVGLSYETTREQMQKVLQGMERVLREHPRIWPDAVVVKFMGFGASSLDIEVMAWFQVPTWGDFQRCREEVFLDFMLVVEDAGTSFSTPTRTIQVVNQLHPGPS
jgi:MscS family membrane protein